MTVPIVCPGKEQVAIGVGDHAAAFRQTGSVLAERFNVATNHPTVLDEVRAAVKTHEAALVRGEPQLQFRATHRHQEGKCHN